MKNGTKFVAAGLVAAALMFAPVMASAHETGSAMRRMGAAAGALVAGPIGLVAGGAIGYVEGPHISHHIFHDHHHYRHYRRHRHHDYR